MTVSWGFPRDAQNSFLQLYQSEVSLSLFQSKCLNSLILLQHFFSHLKCPFTTWQLPQDSIPPNANWILGVRLRAGATGITCSLSRDFQIQPPAAEGRRETTYPGMAEWNNPSTAGGQQQNQKLPKEELNSCLRMQLWSHGGHCLQHKVHHQPECQRDPLAPGLLWGSTAASPLIPSSCATAALGFSTHLCPCQDKSALWDSVGWELGIRASSLWELRAGMGVHQLLLPTGDEDLQNGGDAMATPGCGFPYTQLACARVQYAQPEYTAFCTTDHTFACHYSAYK